MLYLVLGEGKVVSFVTLRQELHLELACLSSVGVCVYTHLCMYVLILYICVHCHLFFLFLYTCMCMYLRMYVSVYVCACVWMHALSI